MTSAGRELLKWVALVLMTGDHVNKVLLANSAPWLSEAARVVFPIFAIVLVYNLRTHRHDDATARALIRLLIAAVIAQPLHALAFGYWLPLNVLFTLALGVYVASARNGWLAAAAWILGGAFVDYQWAGVGVIVAASVALRLNGHWRGWLLLAAAIAALYVINGNLWAVLALPLVWWLSRSTSDVPRWRWTFYGYYMAHLAVLVCLANLNY